MEGWGYFFIAKKGEAMGYFKMKNLLITLAISASMLVMATVTAAACTTIYVGGNLTDDGNSYFGRTEDYAAHMNKMWKISEAGEWKEGDTYIGCDFGDGEDYGFHWTWTHDSYRFTHYTENTIGGYCPECGAEGVNHYAYTVGGTNDKGVSMTATETISGKRAVRNVDPYAYSDDPQGIEETDINTIILGEAATARQGVELLCSIYANYGAQGGSGIIIADKNEAWYIENLSGTQYLAVKLNPDILLVQANMEIIGEIDLDDTENVIASEKLIAVAKEAGTFVGDEEKNIIDYRKSYSNNSGRNADGRLVASVHFLDNSKSPTAAELGQDETTFTISNIKDGEIVAPYTNLTADRKLTMDDIYKYYQIPSIGYNRNLDLEVFQINSDPDLEVEYSTIGWVNLANSGWNVLVPCYPMLIDDVHASCQIDAQPKRVAGKQVEGVALPYRNTWYKYPDNWADSMYYVYEALGEYMTNSATISGKAMDAATTAYVRGELDKAQASFYESVPTVAELKAAEDQRALATDSLLDMQEEAYQLGRSLATNLVVKGKIDAIGEVTLDKEAAIAAARAEYDALANKDERIVGAKYEQSLINAEQKLEVLKLQKENEEQAEAIAQANALIDSLTTELNTLKESSAADEATIAELEAQLEELQGVADELAESTATKDELTEQINTLNGTIASLNNTITELQNELNNKESAETTLNNSKKAAVDEINKYVEDNLANIFDEDKYDVEIAALKGILAVKDAEKAEEIQPAVDKAKAVVDEKVKIKADTEAAEALEVTGLKAKSKKQKFTVSWTANEEAEAYQVQYKLATAKKFTNLKKSVKAVKATSKKLKKGKKYVFQVRTIKTVNGKTVYGKWVATKAVKCK